jgi:mRNA interferase RelE/StbE
VDVDLSQAQEDFDALPVTMKARVRDIVKRLEKWPSVSGAKPLRKAWAGHYRVRSGDYRIIFRVEPDLVRIVRIGHRADIYEE